MCDEVSLSKAPPSHCSWCGELPCMVDMGECVHEWVNVMWQYWCIRLWMKALYTHT